MPYENVLELENLVLELKKTPLILNIGTIGILVKKNVSLCVLSPHI